MGVVDLIWESSKRCHGLHRALPGPLSGHHSPETVEIKHWTELSPERWPRLNQVLETRHLSLDRGPRLARPENLVLMALMPKFPQAGPTS